LFVLTESDTLDAPVLLSTLWRLQLITL
jgi:hypothetical protein